MTSQQIHRMDWAADSLSRVGDLRAHALGLFSIEAVAFELATIRETLIVPKTAFPYDATITQTSPQPKRQSLF